jgi:CheY-like chemotaxis protein
VEKQRSDFQLAGLELAVESPEVPVWVTADPTQLTQVLDHLLHNAQKFTERGGKVELRMQVEPEGRKAILTVRHTGGSIKPETTCAKDSSGLDLATVRSIIELHGGEVSTMSAGPDRAVDFTVRLPAEPEPAALTQVLTEPEQDEHHLRILVVEDNRDSAESLRMLLELYGYEVTVAYTGPDGVKAAEECKPNIVLCDIGLPGLDGYGVARHLRRNPATAKTPIIAVTGYGTDEDRHRSREAGFDRHMVKPVDPEALHQALAALG